MLDKMIDLTRDSWEIGNRNEDVLPAFCHLGRAFGSWG